MRIRSNNRFSGYGFGSFLLAAMLLLVAPACEGPTGPPGPRGEQGSQGSAGPPGPTGEDGNANVISSDWIPVDFPDVAVTGANFDINDPNIDEEVLASAAILSYARVNNTTVIEIPFTFQNRSYFIVLFSSINVIRFRAVAVDGTTAQIFNDFQDVRYVIIPASTTSESGTASNSKTALLEDLRSKGVDVSDFYAVADYYGLRY